MITIQPEAKSQLLCARPGCGHSEDEHNWGNGSCNHKNILENAAGDRLHVNCLCYSFLNPLLGDGL